MRCVKDSVDDKKTVAIELEIMAAIHQTIVNCSISEQTPRHMQASNKVFVKRETNQEFLSKIKKNYR